MAFDYFSQLQGPVISTSLFPDAAQAGANTGLKIPSTTSAIVRGIQQGVDRGFSDIERFQQAEIRQNQIENQPLDRQLKEQQLKNDQLRNEIAALSIQEAKATEDLALKAKRAELIQKTRQAELQLQELNTQESLYNDLEDPMLAKNIFNNPKYTGMLIKDPKLAENILGNIYQRKLIGDDEARRLSGAINLQKTIQNEAELRKATLKELDTIVSNVRNDSEITAIIGEVDPRSDLKVYPSGLKQTFPDSNKINPAATDNVKVLQQPTDTFDIFVNGEKKGVVKQAQAAKLQKLVNNQEKLNKLSGVPSPTETQQQVQEEPQQPESPTPTIPSIARSKPLEQLGVTPEEATPLLDIAAQRAERSTIFQRALSYIIPDFLEGNLIKDADVKADEYPDSAQAKKTIDNVTNRLASKTLSTLNNGTTEEKQALRTWADVNDVPLNSSGIKRYYREKVTDALSNAYNEAYEVGLQNLALSKQQRNAVDAQRRVNEEALRGISPDEAISLQTTPPQAPEQPDLVSAQRVPAPDASGDITTTTPLAGQGAEAGGLNTPISSTTPDVDLDNLNKPADVIQTSVPPSKLIPLDPKEVSANVDKLSNALNLPAHVTRDVKTKALRVAQNKYFDEEPYYVRALGAVESGGVTGAVSPTGVKGLMQVTKSVAGSYGLDRDDPEQNVMAGRLYIEDLIKMFKGNRMLAYAAYNTGPGVVRFAQKLAGGSNNWYEVKRFIYDALTKYRKHFADPRAKFSEVYNYPERVALFEEVFGGG